MKRYHGIDATPSENYDTEVNKQGTPRGRHTHVHGCLARNSLAHLHVDSAPFSEKQPKVKFVRKEK